MRQCNDLKFQAYNALLEETFSYINKEAYEAHVAMAADNARLQDTTARFFLHGGTIYPDVSPAGAPVTFTKVTAPLLHYTLFERFDAINRRTNDTSVTIKNYFSAVLSHSSNYLVLEALLPSVLLSRVRSELTADEFAIIDSGSDMLTPIEPVSETKAAIQRIKEHYADAILLLKDLLMEKFLLQE